MAAISDAQIKERIKEDIRKQFRNMNAKAGHTLPLRWILHKYFPTLNPRQQDLFEEALGEMANAGEIELGDGEAMVKLTETGQSVLYA